MTISGEDSKLDLIDEAYLCAQHLGISDRLIIFLACTYANQLVQLIVLISPYGGLAVGFSWALDMVVTGIGRLLFRDWIPT